MIKAVLFDLDGTLLESEPAWRQAAIRLLCRKDQLIPPYILENIDHLLFREQLRLLLADESIHLDMTYEECERWCLDDIARLYAHSLHLKPGARALLQALKAAGVPVALATASSESWVRPALERLNVLPYFDCLRCGLSAQSPITKGDAVLYDEIAAALNVRVQDCLLVDDALYALRGAKSAGAACWAVEEYTRMHEREEIQAEAGRYFSSLTALTGALLPEIASER